MAKKYIFFLKKLFLVSIKLASHFNHHYQALCQRKKISHKTKVVRDEMTLLIFCSFFAVHQTHVAKRDNFCQCECGSPKHNRNHNCCYSWDSHSTTDAQWSDWGQLSTCHSWALDFLAHKCHSVQRKIIHVWEYLLIVFPCLKTGSRNLYGEYFLLACT